jgi:hypothetical protein
MTAFFRTIGGDYIRMQATMTEQEFMDNIVEMIVRTN